MGKRCKKKHKGLGHNRSQKRGVRDLKHRGKDLDQIYESLLKPKSSEIQQEGPQYELQGQGRFYCQFCDRYFLDEKSIQSHSNEKTHKRRVKALMDFTPHEP